MKEEREILDDLSQLPVKKKLFTTWFLIVSVVSILLTFGIIGMNSIGLLSHSLQTNILSMLNLIAGVSALAGFIMGCVEWKLHRMRALVGIIGNALILCGYVVFAVIIFYVISNLAPN